ncbi:zinc ABC transporter permease [Vallitalea longa]|uniref:Zinc ABC transporter permease n=1 Tax=Vallitalea longa TaxID=2936439 RepID=A0A9W5YC04_9FIRM|nr:metal ABC transporter permease [Vallitalea longa]GKX29886.1 zinc ABC transporter permease [Vallitalea longa]
MTPQLEIQIIAVIVAVACSIPGVFLVLRKMAMMSDAITHTILLGIVGAYFIVFDLSSPLLIMGAAVVGLLTVYLVELLNSTKLLSEDSAIGVVFPLLFSIAIIIVSKYASSVHLDTDSVLLGELAFAPFNRMVIGGVDIGAKAIYSMGTVLLINLVLVIVFFKELKLATFDKGLAAVLGFSPILIHYGLMTSVSVTAVGAFEAVGSILVIAFMVGPPISAYLITDDLKKMIILSAFIGAVNAIIGYQFADLLDVSIAGCMATFTGISFMLIFIFAPKRGMITIIRRRKYQEIDFAAKTMLFHVYNHEGDENEYIENGIVSISNHLNWQKDFLERIVIKLKSDNFIVETNGIFKLTEEGREYANKSYEEIIAE